MRGGNVAAEDVAAGDEIGAERFVLEFVLRDVSAGDGEDVFAFWAAGRLEVPFLAKAPFDAVTFRFGTDSDFGVTGFVLFAVFFVVFLAMDIQTMKGKIGIRFGFRESALTAKDAD